MALAFKILSGDQKGQLFPIEDGITIGRQSQQVPLNDPKASSHHARVAVEDGRFKLIDNNSKNGIHVNGQKVAELDLIDGAEFSIGDVLFKIVKHDSEKLREKRAKKGQHLWYEALADFVERSTENLQDKPIRFQPLEPAVMFEFVRGVQMNTRWIVGYGPRKIGSGSIDLSIYENKAPDVCFEIEGTPNGILFRTQHPGIVRLNDKEVSSQILHIGDRIRINDTVIEVDFVE